MRLGCTDADLAAIEAVDERLFRADALRGDRLLTGLCDRFPVSLWSVFTAGLFVQLRAFLSSDEFYAVLLENGYVHCAFARFLRRHFPGAEPQIKLESTIEDVASTIPANDGLNGEIYLNPALRLIYLPTGLLESYLAARREIQRTGLGGAAFLLSPELNRLELPPSFDAQMTEAILVEPGMPVQVGGVNPALAKVLEYVKVPRSKAAVVALLKEEGADHGECDTLLNQFRGESWIKGQLFSPVG